MKKLILVLSLLALICPFMGMKLYLTNTSSSGQAQSDPNASLGGYRSTTELSATSMKNLFDDVSVVEALLGDTEYRMIDVYNDGTGTAYGVQLYMQTATSSSSTELDFGYSSTNQPHADAWNGEALSNESTAPASPSMSFSHYTKTSPLSLGTIPASQSKRVCVRRTVTAGAPWTAHDLGRFGVRWGGVAAPAGFCSTCTGSGSSPAFCWEVTANDATITNSGGCSVGDTAATANSAVSLASAPTGKTGYAVTWSTAQDYYAFDVSSDDLVDDAAGTVVFDFYVTTFTGYTNMFTVRALSGEDELYIEMYGTDELRLRHEGSNAGATSATTSGADLQLNTWYTVTAKWRTGNQSGNPTLSINVNNVTATSSTTLTAFTNQPGSNNLMIGNPTGSANGASVKNIKIYKAWVD